MSTVTLAGVQVKDRRPRKPARRRIPCPALDVVEVPRGPGHPTGSFDLVDAYGVTVGSYLTRRGAESAKVRMEACWGRALIAEAPGEVEAIARSLRSLLTVAECVGDDHPHSAEISFPTPEPDEPGVFAEDRIDWCHMSNVGFDGWDAETGDEVLNLEDEELAALIRRRPDLAAPHDAW